MIVECVVSHLMLLMPVCCCGHLRPHACDCQLLQEKCNQCSRLTKADHSSRHHLCHDCDYYRRHPVLPPLPPSPPPASLSPPPEASLFGRPSGCIDQLTEVERAAIITLHKVGWAGHDIADVIKCSENTVWSQPCVGAASFWCSI